MFLAKKAQAAKLETEMKELKVEIDSELDLIAKNNGFANGKLGLPGVAMVSVTMNPAKLVWSDGKALSVADREGLALLLPSVYVKQDIRVAELAKGVGRGLNEARTILNEKGVRVEQDSRYDIKAA